VPAVTCVLDHHPSVNNNVCAGSPQACLQCELLTQQGSTAMQQLDKAHLSSSCGARLVYRNAVGGLLCFF